MADGNLFAAQVVTPERILVNGVASEIILKTGEGEASFLSGHTPLVGSVEPGVVRVVTPGGEVVVAVHGGFVQVEQHVPSAEVEAGLAGEGVPALPDELSRVTLLAGVAELAEEIDVERARVAQEAATHRVSELSGSGRSGAGEGEEADTELVEAEAAVRRAEVRLEAAGALSGASSS